MATTKKKAPVKKAPAKKAATTKKVAATQRRWSTPAAPATAAEPDRNPWGEAQKKLEAFGIENICARIIEGKLLAEVAAQAGVSSGALLAWLDASPERSARAREARKLGAAVLEEQAQQAIQNAKDGFQLSKAKELAHHLRWKASKLDARSFGDKLALGQAHDLPPLPAPTQNTNVSLALEIAPADAYTAMLQRKKV